MFGVIKNGCTLSVKNFEGPLDLLLDLIQESKLVITDISLSSITDQYLMYLKTLQLFNIDIASEFFVIAASLVYIKTKRLLPNLKKDEDEIFDEKELIEKLKEYKKYKYISKILWNKKEEGDVYYSRGYLVNPFGKLKTLDCEPVLIGDLLQVLNRYRGYFIKKPIPIKRREVSVEEKMNHIMNLLNIKKQVKFSELAKEEKTKVDKVASFLGGLELSFRQKVLLRQLELFMDIDIIRKEMSLLHNL
jgi:segregation and condensation protein A